MFGILLRWISTAATVIVVLGFAMFVYDQSAKGSQAQVNKIEASQGPVLDRPNEVKRERENGKVREWLSDANDVLLTPFAVVDSPYVWVQRLVPTVLALLVYGFLLMVLANYLNRPKRREIQSFGTDARD